MIKAGADAATVTIKGHHKATELQLLDAGGTINFADNAVFDGAINSTVGGAAGILNFAGAGTVTGTIGANAPLAEVNFNHAGIVTLGGAANAAIFNYKVDATVNAAGLITGNVATDTADTGTLNFTGAGGVTGTIGAINSLLLVQFDASGVDIILGDAVKAKTFKYGDLDRITASGLITGDVDFNNKAGILKAGQINGKVFSTGAINGTLEFIRTGGVSADVTDLALVHFNAGGNKITLGGEVKATTIKYLAADNVIVAGEIIGDIDFDGKDGALEAQNKVTGNVDNNGVANKGTLNFTTVNGQVTGNIGAANKLKEINIGLAAVNNVNAVAVLKGAVINVDTITLSASSVVVGGPYTSTLLLDSVNGLQTVTGDIVSTAIANGGMSVLGFKGANNITVTGNIGAVGVPLSEIHFNANTNVIVLNGAVNANLIKYLTANKVTVTGELTGNIDFNGQDGELTAEAKITGDVNNIVGIAGKGVLNFTTAAGEVSGAIGGAGALKTINIKGLEAKAHLSNATVKAANINIGEAANAGTLIRSGASDFNVNGVGISQINFENADSVLELLNVHGSADDRTITLFDNLTGKADIEGIVKLNSAAFGKKLTIAENAGKTIGVDAGARIKELIVDGLGNTDIKVAAFAQKATLGKVSIGAYDIGTVNFVNGLELGQGGSIKVNQNTTLQGDITNDGAGGVTTIDLGQNTLTYNNGTAKFDGDVEINTSINNIHNKAGVGNIVITGPAGLNLSGVNTLTINLDGSSNLRDNGKVYQILTFIPASIVGLPAGKTVFNNKDLRVPLPTWSYDATTGAVTLPAAPAGGVVLPTGAIIPGTNPSSLKPDANSVLAAAKNKVIILNNKNKNAYTSYELEIHDIGFASKKVNKIKEGLTKDFGTTNSEIVVAFADVNMDQDTDAADTVTELGILSLADPVRLQEAADRLSVVTPSKAVVSVTTGVMHAAQSTIGTRLDNISVGTNNNAVGVSKDIGVASGDELDSRYGVWGSPFYSQSTQKKNGNTPGYKGKSSGGTIGFDYLANDNLTLGTALTLINTKIDHKNQKSGDTTKVESTLFSIYGVQQLPNNFFVQGIVSFGLNKVRNKEKRIINLTDDQTATGKYNSRSYSGEVLAGYRYDLANSQAVLTPMLGLRYGKFDDGGYTETGTSHRNMTVSKKSVDKVEGVIGGRMSFFSQTNNGLLMPEVHGFVSYDFKNKAPKVDARLNGAMAAMPTKTSKPERTLVNLGTSVTIKHTITEYGFGYDAYLAKKLVSHQGSLKLRINF